MAGHLLGLAIGGLTADGNGGQATVALTRDHVEVALEEVVDDLVVLLAGDEVDRRSLPRFSSEGGDARQAYEIASPVTSNPDEAEGLFEYARARTRTLASSTLFVDLVEVLAARLTERGELEASEVEAILEPEGDDSNGTP